MRGSPVAKKRTQQVSLGSWNLFSPVAGVSAVTLAKYPSIYGLTLHVSMFCRIRSFIAHVPINFVDPAASLGDALDLPEKIIAKVVMLGKLLPASLAPCKISPTFERTL